MTDEELARDYALTRQKNLHLSQKDTNLIQLAYLHGLKASRPKWHDLRKDPNDLPENKRNVWCDYGDSCGKGYYDRYNGCWCIEHHLCCSIIDAWCELPQFKE